MGRSNAGSINVHVCCNPVQPAVACCGATPVVLWGEIDFSESRVAVNSRDVDEVNRNAVLNLRGLPYKITNRGLGSVTFPPPLQLLPLFRFTKCAVRALFRYCFLAAAAQPLSFFPGFALLRLKKVDKAETSCWLVYTRDASAVEPLFCFVCE